MSHARINSQNDSATKIQANLFSTLFWLGLFLFSAAVLIVMKYIQQGWESAYGNDAGGWVYAFKHRIPNISFQILFAMCFQGFCLWWPIQTMIKANLIPNGEITFKRKHLCWVFALIVFNWANYFQAVYRDGGTFLWSHGDGMGPVALEWLQRASCPTNDYDKLGPIFPLPKTDKQIGELSEDEQRHLSALRRIWSLNSITNNSDRLSLTELSSRIGLGCYSQMTDDLKLSFSNRAKNTKKLAGLQVVEGMIFLLLLVLWAFLGVLINIYVTCLGKQDEYSSQFPKKAVVELLAVCLIPNSVLAIFSAWHIWTDLKTGITDASLAVLSALVFWIPVGWAVIRIWLHCKGAIENPFTRKNG